MVTMPDGYYTHFDAAKNRESILWRAGRVVQGAELSEEGDLSRHRLKQVADALFKDGAVIRDAGINVNQQTGLCSLAAGVIYARGAMRGVAPAAFTISLVGTVSVGIYLVDTVVTELEDPTLRDPAVAVRNYAAPGASRLVVTAVWGFAGDGQEGAFYPVYTVVDGVVVGQQPPPNIDAIALAIAAYDRDSTGGHYITSGFRLTALADGTAGAEAGKQIYNLEAGNARVNGRQVLMTHAARVLYDPEPTQALKVVLVESKTALGGTERVNTSHSPIFDIQQVSITTQKVVTTQKRGDVGNSADLLPDPSVVSIVAVNQGGTWNGSAFSGGTTYTQGTDYTLTSDSVNWSPSGVGTAEPATGSTYSVVYRYNAAVAPTAVDTTGFTVSGAVANTSILISYRWLRPRIDRICLDTEGRIVWVKGVPNDVAPRAPAIPAGLLPVASVRQTWPLSYLNRQVSNDGVRMQSMSQIEGLETKVDNLFAVVSEHQLKTQAALTDPSSKRGIFVDNFINDLQRDQGIAQTAAVVDGALTLAIDVASIQVKQADLGGPQTLPMNAAGAYPVVQQTLRTGCMKVNPYDAFEPIPPRCTIAPAVDFWTAVQTAWLSPVTRRFTTEREVIDRTTSLGWLTREIGVTRELVVTNSTELVRTRTEEAQFLRQIEISFTLQGLGAGEILNSVKFDGIAVAFTA
jgi:Domain of unknown function (DUF4815)